MPPLGTVFLVDDDDALRRATARLLTACDFQVRTFSSAEEFLASLDPSAPGCLLLDLRMPGQSGLELQSALTRRGSRLPIVFLTGHADVPTSVLAMREGAIDVLEKPVAEEVLLAALTRAMERDRVLRLEDRERDKDKDQLAKLTPREHEVLLELMANQRNKQVARALGIAERTVKLHRANLMKKMGAETLADLGKIAQRLGLGPRGSPPPGHSGPT